MLINYGALPWFGIADPASIPWLGYTSAILMLIFPLTLSYVVIVQRAMDVRILLRMGTKSALARTTMAIVQLAVAALILIFFVIPVIAGHRISDSLGLVLALLAIAGLVAMFFARGVLGSRFQNWLDRKFFREAYDAEVILNELAGQARTFTDSHSLIETVAHRISEVLHVPQIAVLLAQGGSFRVQQSKGLSVNGALALSTAGSTIQHLMHTASPAVVDHKTPDRWLEEAVRRKGNCWQKREQSCSCPCLGATGYWDC